MLDENLRVGGMHLILNELINLWQIFYAVILRYYFFVFFCSHVLYNRQMLIFGLFSVAPEVIILAHKSDMYAKVVSKAFTAIGKENLILLFDSLPSVMTVSFEFDVHGATVDNKSCFRSVSRVWVSS